MVYITSAPPEGMEWLTANKAADLNINTLSLDDDSDEDPTVETATSPDDPLAAVTPLYGSLGQADGEAASALLSRRSEG